MAGGIRLLIMVQNNPNYHRLHFLLKEVYLYFIYGNEYWECDMGTNLKMKLWTLRRNKESLKKKEDLGSPFRHLIVLDLFLIVEDSFVEAK